MYTAVVSLLAILFIFTNVLVPQITAKLDITAITNTTIICLMNGVLKIGRITNSFYHHCFFIY